MNDKEGACDRGEFSEKRTIMHAVSHGKLAAIRHFVDKDIVEKLERAPREITKTGEIRISITLKDLHELSKFNCLVVAMKEV